MTELPRELFTEENWSEEELADFETARKLESKGFGLLTKLEKSETTTVIPNRENPWIINAQGRVMAPEQLEKIPPLKIGDSNSEELRDACSYFTIYQRYKEFISLDG
ncbi:hypothetical protein HN832_02375 [archaeon]|jgi:hypothetical protein|nr:hypothetical protein [archaeon]MBT4373200.1 hypothetical protein [archaeon]MBT4531545.1 hypothetical protein [archaeon]MBT7001277.1 hypothetical protein [archaeon]MBT7282237.1 hypothetical protein [archaeon]